MQQSQKVALRLHPLYESRHLYALLVSLQRSLHPRRGQKLRGHAFCIRVQLATTIRWSVLRGAQQSSRICWCKLTGCQLSITVMVTTWTFSLGEGEHLLEARCDDDAALRPADALYVVVRNKNDVHYSISSPAASCSLGVTPCETGGQQRFEKQVFFLGRTTAMGKRAVCPHLWHLNGQEGVPS